MTQLGIAEGWGGERECGTYFKFKADIENILIKILLPFAVVAKATEDGSRSRSWGCRQTWQAADSFQGEAREGCQGGIVETEIIKTLNELHNSQIHFRPGKDAKGCRINLCGPAL